MVVECGREMTALKSCVVNMDHLSICSSSSISGLSMWHFRGTELQSGISACHDLLEDDLVLVLTAGNDRAVL